MILIEVHFLVIHDMLCNLKGLDGRAQVFICQILLLHSLSIEEKSIVHVGLAAGTQIDKGVVHLLSLRSYHKHVVWLVLLFLNLKLYST